MQQICEWTTKWPICKIKNWSSSNSFVQIPQEHKDEEHTQQIHSKTLNVKDLDKKCPLSIYGKYLLNAKCQTPSKEVAHTSSGGTNVHDSKANLLNTKQLIGFAFFAVTGGSFGVQECFKLGGPMLIFVTFFFILFMWIIPITVMTLEMTCMIPETGGHVLWVYRAFGPFWSYMNGSFAFACNVLDNAMYPSLFLEYVSLLLPKKSHNSLNHAWSTFIKILILIFATIVNIIGIDLVGNISLVLAFTIIGSLFVIFCAGIKFMNLSWMALAIPKNVNRGRFLATILWNTSGFDMVGTCASEVLTPTYSYTRALIYGSLFVLGSNILPVFIASSIFPSQEDWNVRTYSDVAKVIGGNSFKVWMEVVALFSILGFLLIRLCTNSRILFGMAQVDQMPAALTTLCATFHTPIVAILVTSLCAIVLNFFDFHFLVEADMLFYALSTLLEFGALIQLRYTEPDVLRPFQIPFESNLLALLTCFPMAMCIIILVSASEQSQGIALIGAAIVVFSYIGKECFAQYGMKEVAEKRLVRVQENLERMQKRIDDIIESEIKVLDSKKVKVSLKNWTSRAKFRVATKNKT